MSVFLYVFGFSPNRYVIFLLVVLHMEFNLLCLKALILMFLFQILGVEMLSVLHRVLLTRDSLDIHLAAMRVVKQIVKAAQESLDGKKAAVTK